MNNSDPGSKSDLSVKDAGKPEAEVDLEPGLKHGFHRVTRCIVDKCPAWLRPNRVRAPGVAPKRFSVWLGRLRRRRA